jgi:hypothetical protein
MDLSRFSIPWDKACRLVAQSPGDEGIRWSRRVGSEAVGRRIDRLVADQADPGIAMWLKVRHGARRMTEVAKEYGYRDGSGVHRVIQRLEARANSDRQLACHPRMASPKNRPHKTS